MLQRRHENDFIDRTSGLNLLDNLVTQDELIERTNLNFKAYDFIPENTFYSIPGLSATSAKYSRGCLTEYNTIVFPPCQTNDVLILDVATNTYKYIPISFPFFTSQNKFTDAIYFEKKCYFVPFNYTSVMVFDPVTYAYSFFGNLTIPTTNYWGHGTLSTNGCIYAPPFQSTTILKINCRTKTVSELSVGSSGWQGSCLALNGKIYCPPVSANVVMIINPVNDTWDISTLITTPPSETSGWNSMICAQNGKLYGIPANSVHVLVVNPNTNAVTLINTSDATTNKWRGGALAPNGKIYCPPRVNTNILIIDPTNDSIDMTTLTGISESTNQYDSFVAAPNACLYAAPRNNTDVMVVRTGVPILGNWMFNAGFN